MHANADTRSPSASGANKAVASEKSWSLVLVLSVLFGLYGIDRFYVGRTGLGIIKLATFGGLGIWWAADIYLVATESMRDGEDRRIVRMRDGKAPHRDIEGGWQKIAWTVGGVMVLLSVIGNISPDDEQSSADVNSQAGRTYSRTELTVKRIPISMRSDYGTIDVNSVRFGAGSVWALSRGAVARVDSDTGMVEKQWDIGDDDADVTDGVFAEGSLWVLDDKPDVIYRLDAGTNSMVDVFSAMYDTEQLSYWDGMLYAEHGMNANTWQSYETVTDMPVDDGTGDVPDAVQEYWTSRADTGIASHATTLNETEDGLDYDQFGFKVPGMSRVVFTEDDVCDVVDSDSCTVDHIASVAYDGHSYWLLNDKRSDGKENVLSYNPTTHEWSPISITVMGGYGELFSDGKAVWVTGERLTMIRLPR